MDIAKEEWIHFSDAQAVDAGEVILIQILDANGTPRYSQKALIPEGKTSSVTISIQGQVVDVE